MQYLGQELPERVWGSLHIQNIVEEYLGAETEAQRDDLWDLLVEAVEERLDIWNTAQVEALQGVQSGALSSSRGTRSDAPREQAKKVRGLEANWFVGDRTRAMVQAMSELFAMLAYQYPEVKEFREKVLGSRFLTADEAHAFIASYATRTFSRRWFEEWGIPFVGHSAKILDNGPRGEKVKPIDDWMTIQVNPPGITKTVHYAYPREGDPNRRRATASLVVPASAQVEQGRGSLAWLRCAWHRSLLSAFCGPSTTTTNCITANARRLSEAPPTLP